VGNAETLTENELFLVPSLLNDSKRHANLSVDCVHVLILEPFISLQHSDEPIKWCIGTRKLGDYVTDPVINSIQA
jgi:hypothetical protein